LVAMWLCTTVLVQLQSSSAFFKTKWLSVKRDDYVFFKIYQLIMFQNC
jgi:hypothetical protein